MCTIDHEISTKMNKYNSKKTNFCFLFNYCFVFCFLDFAPFDYNLSQVPDNLVSLKKPVVCIIRKLLS